MSHSLSDDDRRFVAQFESFIVAPGDFDHRAHLRLAYCYLAEYHTETACEMMGNALRGFLEHHGVDPGKYHETLTRAWIQAVRHFMNKPPDAKSADGFIDKHPELLDPAIMLTHYSAEVLFSDQARQRFVEPDLEPIPGPHR